MELPSSASERRIGTRHVEPTYREIDIGLREERFRIGELDR
jgi:hypothetical protein